MGTNTSGAALIADGTNFNPVVISGDATVATNGALTIANDAITSAKIADDAITSALIADDAVVTAAIADDAITAALIADDAVGSAAIADDAITSALIADDAITSALIADDAVVSAAIADNAVTTALINDDAVTLAKMAGLARGKIIYGDSSGNPAALAIGSNNYVLTSDGTDAAWAAATTGAVTSYTNSTNNRVITSVDSTTINGEANLTFDGSALNVVGTLTVGVDDTGHDVKFFGATSGSYMLWDESEDDLILGGAARMGIGTTDLSLYNAVGGTTALAVVGDSSSTAILGNTGASIAIVNTDTTSENTAGLHFARADTDNTPNFAGASIVAQFGETQATGQYPSATLNFLTSSTQNAAPSVKMTIAANGDTNVINDLSIGGTFGASFPLDLRGAGATAAQAMRVADASPTEYFGIFNCNSGAAGPNAANACVKIRGMATTTRSINAGGTVNASGADYAEYMTKADGCGTIEKGSVCGVNADGKLTDVFANAHSFVVKSTDPSYVGGDTWGIKSTDSDGNETMFEADKHEVDEDGNETVLKGEELEAARQKVDRIAFSGQVPCLITGDAAVGDYAIPRAKDDGSIEAVAVSDPTFEQYRAAVGRVWKLNSETKKHIVSVKVS